MKEEIKKALESLRNIVENTELSYVESKRISNMILELVLIENRLDK